MKSIPGSAKTSPTDTAAKPNGSSAMNATAKNAMAKNQVP
jgi:hypothetical protein